MSARSAFAARSARGSSVLLVGIEDAVGVRAAQLLESAGHFVSVAPDSIGAWPLRRPSGSFAEPANRGGPPSPRRLDFGVVRVMMLFGTGR